jgi:putative redox protein
MTLNTIRYAGDLQCEMQHASGAVLVTDAPADNHGRGTHFSPTDLIGNALASCVLTTMAIVAKSQYGFDLGKATGTVEKIMTSTTPRRIAEIVIDLNFALPSDHPQRAHLEKIIDRCPVHHALNPEIKVTVNTHWGAALD